MLMGLALGRAGVLVLLAPEVEGATLVAADCLLVSLICFKSVEENGFMGGLTALTGELALLASDGLEPADDLGTTTSDLAGFDSSDTLVVFFSF